MTIEFKLFQFWYIFFFFHLMNRSNYSCIVSFSYDFKARFLFQLFFCCCFFRFFFRLFFSFIFWKIHLVSPIILFANLFFFFRSFFVHTIHPFNNELSSYFCSYCHQGNSPSFLCSDVFCYLEVSQNSQALLDNSPLYSREKCASY